MTGIEDEELRRLLSAAQAAARQSHPDSQLQEDAAAFAVEALLEALQSVTPAARIAWVRTTARNEVIRLGKLADRELPFGRQGSAPPHRWDASLGNLEEGKAFGAADKEEEELRAAISAGVNRQGPSLGSEVVMAQGFADGWALLTQDARYLLEAKYLCGLSSKEIADERNRGESESSIENKLMRARQAARPLLKGLR